MALTAIGRTRLTATAILTVAAAGALARLAVAPPPLSPPLPLPAVAARPVAIAYHPLPLDQRVAAPARVIAAAPRPLVIRRVLDTGGPLRYGHWFWTGDAAPAGPLTITVDLKASVLSVFRSGDEIGTTAIIYGADSKETPLGTFPILAKERRHFSSRYHHAPMPYMLRLTGDGVSIHASEVAADYATHGCIGVPEGFARKLFAIASIGDKVIVTRKGLRAGLAAT